MKKVINFLTLTFAAVSAALFILIAIYLFKESSSILWSQEAAGWAQAIGSIMAIGVAIGLSQHQNRSATRVMIEADLRQLRRRIDCFQGIVNSAATQVQNVADDLRGVTARETLNRPPSPANPEDDRMYMTMALDNMQKKHPFIGTLAIIDTIPLFDLGSSKLVEAVCNLKNAITNFSNHIEHALAQGEENYSSTSLWNSASVYACFAQQAATDFNTAATKITNAKHS